MFGDVMMALSAACLALAACGALLALRARVPAAGYLVAILALFAALTGFPMVAALNRDLAIGLMPWLLPGLLALSPAIFFYVRQRSAGTPIRRTDWPHAIVPLLGCGVALAVSLLSAETRNALFGLGVSPEGGMVAALMVISFALVVTAPLVSLGYLWASVGKLRAYRAWLKDHLSNLDKRELRWVDGFMLSLVGLWVLVGVALLSDNLGGALWISGEWVLAAVGATLMLVLAFALIAEDSQALSEAQAPQPRYQNSALSDEAAEALALKLEVAVGEERLYLDPNLSLDRLARHLRAAPDHVSQTLNGYMKTSFFDYIARWRVEAAKERLVLSTNSVLEIAIEVGFNSRSTFYKAFNRETGLTPTAYRQAQRKLTE